MPVFKGSTSGSVLQVAYKIPAELVSFSLVNTSGGSITANVYIRDDEGTDISICSQTIASGGDFVSDVKRIVSKGTSIYLIVSGSCDYYFSLT